jgi:hypothetical protein
MSCICRSMGRKFVCTSRKFYVELPRARPMLAGSQLCSSVTKRPRVVCASCSGGWSRGIEKTERCARGSRHLFKQAHFEVLNGKPTKLFNWQPYRIWSNCFIGFVHSCFIHIPLGSSFASRLARAQYFYCKSHGSMCLGMDGSKQSFLWLKYSNTSICTMNLQHFFVLLKWLCWVDVCRTLRLR